MIKQPDPFTKLKNLSKTTTLLSSINMLLEWDQETYMPEEAIESRSDQLELLASLIHKEKTSPSFKKALTELVDLETGKLHKKDQGILIEACVREWRREFFQAAKIPPSFVKQFAKASSAALHVWAEAKKTANFALFAPHLEKIVSLSRNKAQFLGYSNHPYDALLDIYEPGLTVDRLTPLFSELKQELIAILKTAPKTPSFSLGTFPQEKQIEVGHLILKAMGFSNKTSRLDTSSHPFCTGIHPLDTRMTTRIDENHPMHSISSVIHEGGHGLYNKNLPKEFYGTPVCDHASFGVDESQSRLWETMIGKGLPFWTFFYPKLQEIFEENLKDIPLHDFYRSINQVEPSTIRVEADEVTYCLHVILRFELEKGLMDGTIEVPEIPTLWNKKMEESLFITPPHDGEGCLQDIHWAMGGIGYFPTYILGNLLAAELFKKIKTTFPDWQKRIESGDLSFIEQWLKENIHCHGKIYTPDELILKITGKPLGIEAYISYLKEKYASL